MIVVVEIVGRLLAKIVKTCKNEMTDGKVVCIPIGLISILVHIADL